MMRSCSRGRRLIVGKSSPRVSRRRKSRATCSRLLADGTNLKWRLWMTASRERASKSALCMSGHIKDFFGWNRAKHAVLEAAILATRVHLLSESEIQEQLERLRIPIEKTAGPKEAEAFALLQRLRRRPLRRGRAVMSVHVTIQTGARLHFGLLAHRPLSGRHFGGAGLMIDSPGVHLYCQRSSHAMKCIAPLRSRNESKGSSPTIGSRRGRRHATALPSRSASNDSRPSRVGFGNPVGIGRGQSLGDFGRSEDQDIHPFELAQRVGRGKRSALGIYGFLFGGFLVDGGKRSLEMRHWHVHCPALFPRRVAVGFNHSAA